MIFTEIRVPRVYADFLYGKAYATSEQVCSPYQRFLPGAPSVRPLAIRWVPLCRTPEPPSSNPPTPSTQTAKPPAVSAKPCQAPKPTEIPLTR